MWCWWYLQLPQGFLCRLCCLILNKTVTHGQQFTWKAKQQCRKTLKKCTERDINWTNFTFQVVEIYTLNIYEQLLLNCDKNLEFHWQNAYYFSKNLKFTSARREKMQIHERFLVVFSTFIILLLKEYIYSSWFLTFFLRNLSTTKLQLTKNNVQNVIDTFPQKQSRLFCYLKLIPLKTFKFKALYEMSRVKIYDIHLWAFVFIFTKKCSQLLWVFWKDKWKSMYR